MTRLQSERPNLSDRTLPFLASQSMKTEQHKPSFASGIVLAMRKAGSCFVQQLTIASLCEA